MVQKLSDLYDANFKKVRGKASEGFIRPTLSQFLMSNNDFVEIISGPSIKGSFVFNDNGITYSISLTKTNSNKFVVFYCDDNNSDYGTYVVGSISGDSITLGPPTVFHSAMITYIDSTYDSTSDKVVVVYNYHAYGRGEARVGTVDEYSISFGSPVTFNSGTNTRFNSVIYDSDNDKVVVSYNNFNSTNLSSAFGGTKVGYTNGNSIVFGSLVKFRESGNPAYITSIYDETNNKVVIAYNDWENNRYGTSIVGEVIGNSITFGDAVVFQTSDTYKIDSTYDSTNNKVILCYSDAGDNYKSVYVIGNVSGNSITFGDPTVFIDSWSGRQNRICYGNNKTLLLVYNNVMIGTLNDDNTLSITDSKEFTTESTIDYDVVFDQISENSIIAYRDYSNNGYGTITIVK